MSQRDLIHLTLFDKGVSSANAQSKFVDEKYEGQNRELLTCIDRIIQNSKFKIQNLQGIMVVVGAGSFTSTRIACVVANTFAYALQIPLLAIQESEIDKIQALIPKLLSQPKGQYISATYSGEPNIGGKS